MVDNTQFKKDPLKFDLMISLKSIASAKIVSCLWMSSSIKSKVAHLCYYSGLLQLYEYKEIRVVPFDTKWNEIQRDIVAKVHELELPASLAKILVDIVPFIGKSLFHWMSYLDYIFGSCEFAKSALDSVIWDFRGKVDYSGTAKSILAKEFSWLTADLKYKLACAHCLKDEIIAIAPSVLNPQYLSTVSFEFHPMVHFWTAIVKNDFTYLNIMFSNLDYYVPNYSINMSVNESLFGVLLNKARFVGNQIPLSYIWNNLNDEEKNRNIALFNDDFENREFLLNIMSNLDYDLQNSLFRQCSDIILATMLDDWLWEALFLDTALQILDKMNGKSYTDLLMHLVEEVKACSRRMRDKNLLDAYKFYFQQLWVKAPVHLKEYFFNSEKDGLSSMHSFLDLLSWDQDIDVIKALLNNLNAQQKEQLMSDRYIIRLCFNFIAETPPGANAKVFACFPSEEDISKLRKELINYGVPHNFLYYDDNDEMLSTLEFLLNLAFSPENKSFTKENIVWEKKWCISDTFHSIVVNNEVDFSKLEIHFKWCAHGDPKQIKSFKAELLQHIDAVECMRDLIESDRYDLMNQILHWCFSGDQLSIIQFKKNLHQIVRPPLLEAPMDLLNPLTELIVNLIRKDNSCKLLDKCVEWLFTSDQEVFNFKSWILYPEPGKIYLRDAPNIFVGLLRACELEMANILIRWCLTDPTKIADYKEHLMTGTGTRREDRIFPFNLSISTFKQLLMWFNPSKTVLNKLKSKFEVKNGPNKISTWIDTAEIQALVSDR